MQLAQPVTFACRAPTLSERKYSQIRKKLLAQIFGMEDNHHHVYVQKVILWTDHKPLVSISQKPLASVFKRLQCLLLRLQQYDCEIYYKPGKEMLLADTLSRAYSEDYERSATESEVECIHATHFLPFPDDQLKELQRETACDPTLQFVKKVILDGFSDTKEKQQAAIHQYFEIRDELSVHGGVIFKDQQCIITQSLRQKIKQKLHDSHIGSQGCLCRAQETVYWPGMNAKITNYIQKCDFCMSLQKNHTKEPLICREPISTPWENVATDIFTLDDKNYLCTVTTTLGTLKWIIYMAKQELSS